MTIKKSALGLMLACQLLLSTEGSFTQTASEKPKAPKRVFTNDDLQKYGEKYGAESAPGQITASATASAAKKPDPKGEPADAASKSKGSVSPERAYWIAKLKEAESALTKAKRDEEKFSRGLEMIQTKLSEAKTEFQVKTAQEQVADLHKNMARSKDEIKQAEGGKANVLAGALKKGFKPEDLKEEEEKKPAPAQL